MGLPPKQPEGGWPWAGLYPDAMTPDMPLRHCLVPEIIDRGAGLWPERAAIDFRGREITYLELKQMADCAGAAFRRMGVSEGDRIALYMPNTPAHPVAFFGALKAGAVVVHLSPMDAPRVLEHKLSDSGATLAVTTNFGAMTETAKALLDAGTLDQLIVVDDAIWGHSTETSPLPESDGMTIWHDFADDTDAFMPAAATLDDPVLLQYTGGTTGMPKAAMLTHRNLSAAVASYTAWYDGWGLSTGEAQKILLYLPLFHIYGLSAVLLRTLDGGHTALLRPRFDAENALDEIEAGVNAFPGVPTMWIAICSTPGFETRDLSSLSLVASGGAPMPVEVARRFTTKTGMELLGGWGMSETAPAGTNLPRGWPEKNGSIGIPLPGVFLKIVALDDPARELGCGETGELAVCGHNVTQSYWNRPDENARCFHDEWFLTGDIGYVDEDGFFYIVDRKKDMILSGGFNVYPQMIEQAIYEHDDVEEVLVIGFDDGYRGESAKAFVKLRNGAPGMTLDALQTFLKSRVGRHEMPRALELRESLPKTPVGKLSKIDLKREEAAKAASTEPEKEEHPS